MFLLNLSPLEFLAIFGAVSAFVVHPLSAESISYVVSESASATLLEQAASPVVSKQLPRRIQQPLSPAPATDQHRVAPPGYLANCNGLSSDAGIPARPRAAA